MKMKNHYFVKQDGKIIAIHRKEPLESLRTIINRRKNAERHARVARLLSN